MLNPLDDGVFGTAPARAQPPHIANAALDIFSDEPIGMAQSHQPVLAQQELQMRQPPIAYEEEDFADFASFTGGGNVAAAPKAKAKGSVSPLQSLARGKKSAGAAPNSGTGSSNDEDVSDFVL